MTWIFWPALVSLLVFAGIGVVSGVKLILLRSYMNGWEEGFREGVAIQKSAELALRDLTVAFGTGAVHPQSSLTWPDFLMRH